MKPNYPIADLIGIYPAMLTPFDAHGVNTQAAAKHIATMIADGADGAYICGSSGEMLSMSLEERLDLIEAATDAAKGKGKIIVCIGDTDIRVSKKLAERAQACGAAALAAIPPIYYRVPFAWTRDWMAELASATDLPMLYYNIPSSTGVQLDAAQLNALMDVPGIVGMKFTANDFFALNCVASAHPDYALYNGFDEMLLAGISMGANGYIGTSGNIMAPAVKCIIKSALGGDVLRARKVQTRLNDVITACVPTGVIGSFKVIADLQGVPMGAPRAPQAQISAEARRTIERDILPMVLALNDECRS